MIDILCPILGRPPQAMLRSLEHATQKPYEVFFICSPGDSQIAACKATRHVTWVVPWKPGKADFAKKINYGFERTSGEWVFQAADDIRFHPGWDVEALKMQPAQVIGTNDLHNPAVKAKVHSTHLLISRSYISTQGGTFDSSGTVFSEVYDHQYVDNEFVDLAKFRGVWAFAEHSIVEHLHPAWGLAEWDPTYDKAFRASTNDRRLYFMRARRQQRLSKRKPRYTPAR